MGERRVGELPATSSGEHLADIPSWVARKILEPRAFEVAGAARAAMPAYKISPDEALDIGVAIGALRGRSVPAAYVRRAPHLGQHRLPTGATRQLVERFRCLVCHRIGELGGDVSKVPLDGAASRLNRPWLDEFLREPLTVRMGQAERMPALGMDAADAARLANWIETSLADERITEQPPTTDAEVTTGKRLYGERGCATCHVAEGAGEIKAPVLDGASKRLKLAYVVALLESGPKLVPEGRHPPEVYPRAEARALGAYVLSLPPPPAEQADKPPSPKE